MKYQAKNIIVGILFTPFQPSPTGEGVETDHFPLYWGNSKGC
jgi:hypothetical protein